MQSREVLATGGPFNLPNYYAAQSHVLLSGARRTYEATPATTASGSTLPGTHLLVKFPRLSHVPTTSATFSGFQNAQAVVGLMTGCVAEAHAQHR